MRTRLLVLAGLLFFSGCSTTFQKRGVEQPVPWHRAGALHELEGLANRDGKLVDLRKLNLRLDAEARSIERYRDKGPDGKDKSDFTLGIIEIADDGTFNPAQYRQVFEQLRCELRLAEKLPEEETKRPLTGCEEEYLHLDSKGTLLVVFVHGWHHGCRTCDRDIACFRYVLNELRMAEKQANTGRRVVGVYVGWRGRVLPGRFDVASIWNRKDAARRLGRTAGKELLNDLHDLWMKNTNVTMVTAGHSLGGAFLLSAARGRLTANAADIYRSDPNERTYRTVRAQGERAGPREAGDGTTSEKALRARFGDLLVLLNPAIEADDWKAFDGDLLDEELKGEVAEKELGPDLDRPTRALFEFLGDRELPLDKFGKYHRDQLPVLIAIASEADSAVGRIFPVSRWLAGANVVKNPQVFWRRAQRTAVGHYPAHVTHELKFAGPPRRAEPDYRMESCQCPKEWTESAIPVAIELTLQPEAAVDDPRDFFRSKDGRATWRKGSWSLELTPDRACERPEDKSPNVSRCRGWDSSSPYVVIRTDERVIASHSDVFNPVLIGFLKEYLGAYRSARMSDAKTGF